MKIRINDEVVVEQLRLRIRLDFRAEGKSGRFFFGGKTSEAVAKSIREQQKALLKNVPLQGITFEDFDVSKDIYIVNERAGRRQYEVAYAPLILTLKARNIEDIFPLILRPEFKKVEVLGPENLNIQRRDLERLLYSFFYSYRQELQKVEDYL